MKKVIRTQSLSTVQMANMASNLQEKFNKATNIKFHIWRYRASDPPEGMYDLYVEDYVSTYNLKSWHILQTEYFKLMKV